MAENHVVAGQPVRHPTYGLGRVSRVEDGKALVEFACSPDARLLDATTLVTRDSERGLCNQCLRHAEACLADDEHKECCQVAGRVNHQGDCYSNRRKAKRPYLRHGRLMDS